MSNNPPTGPGIPRGSEPSRSEPLVSDDGGWYWDGQQWRPREPAPPVPRSRPDLDTDAVEDEPWAPAWDPPTRSREGALARIGARSQPIIAPTPPPPPPPEPAGPPPPGYDAKPMVVPGSPVPRTGLSGLLYRTSAGLIKMGPSQQELVRMQLGQQVRTPLAHPPARVAVAGAKGGAGKTTLSLALAATLGRLRHSRIVTYETNHVGTYGTRVVLEHERSMEDLLRLIEKTPNVASIPLPILDLFTSQTPDDRFTILTAPRDPAAARVLGEGEHRKILSLLYRYFDIVIADLDPSILHSSSAYWLGQVADQVIVVSPMAFAGARLADSTLSYVEARRGREWLQQRAIVVVNAIRPGASLAEIEEIDRHFRQRVHHVHRIPWDPHLERGGVFRWDELGESTRDAYLSLAATVGVGFALGQSPNGEGASQG